MKSNLVFSQLPHSSRPSSAEKHKIRTSDRFMYQSPPPAQLETFDPICDMPSRISMNTEPQLDSYCSEYSQIVSGRRTSNQNLNIFYPKNKRSLYGGDSDNEGTISIRSSEKSVRRSWARFYCGSQNMQNQQIQKMEATRKLKLQNFQKQAEKVRHSYECIKAAGSNQRARQTYIAELGVIIFKKDEEIRKKNHQIEQLQLSLRESNAKMEGLRYKCMNEGKSFNTEKYLNLAQMDELKQERMKNYQLSRQFQASKMKISELQDTIGFLSQQQRITVKQRDEEEWARLVKQNGQLQAEINKLGRLISQFQTEKRSQEAERGQKESVARQQSLTQKQQSLSQRELILSQKEQNLSQREPQLKLMIQSLSSRNTEQQNQITQLTTQITQLKSAITQHPKSQSKPDNPKLTHQINVLTEQNQKLTESITTLQQQISNYKMIEVTLKKTQNQLKQLSLRRQIQARKIDQINKQLIQRNEQSLQYSQNRQNMEKDIKRLNEINQLLKQQKQTVKTQLLNFKQCSLQNIQSLNIRLRSEQEQRSYLEQALRSKNKEGSEKSLNSMKLESEIRVKDDLIQKLKSVNAANKEQILKMGKNCQNLLFQVRNLSQKYLKVSKQLEAEQTTRQYLLTSIEESSCNFMKFVVSMQQESQRGYVLLGKYRQIIDNNRIKYEEDESLKNDDLNPEVKFMENIYEILATNIWNLIEIRMGELETNIVKSLKISYAKTDSIAKFMTNGLIPQLKHAVSKRSNKGKRLQTGTFFTDCSMKIKNIITDKICTQFYEQQLNPILQQLFEEIHKMSQQTSQMRNTQYKLQMDNHILYDDNTKFIQQLNYSHQAIVNFQNQNLQLKTTLSTMQNKFKTNNLISNKYKTIIQQQNQQTIKNLMIKKNNMINKE